jgi:hypothetical protein
VFTCHFSNSTRLSRAFTIAATAAIAASALIISAPKALAVAAPDELLLGGEGLSGPVAGQPFFFWASIWKPGAGRDVCSNDTFHFTYTDASTSIPADYTLNTPQFLCEINESADWGAHRFSMVPVKSGTQTLTVSDVTHPLVLPVSLTFDVAPGPVVSFTMSALPASTVQGAETFVQLATRDAEGNLVSGYTGTVHFTSSDGSATLPADYTFNSGDGGTRRFGVSFATTGSQTLNVVDNAARSASRSTTVTAAPYFYVYCSDTSAGYAADCGVMAKTSAGTIDTGYVGTVHFTSSDPSAELPADYTFNPGQLGQASGFDPVFKRAGPQTLTVTDTVNSTIAGQTAVNVSFGDTVAVYLWAQLSTITAGPTFLAVATTDAYGNLGASGTTHYTSTDPSAILPADYTFHPSSYGLHVASATFKTAGTTSVTATLSNFKGTFTSTISLKVTNGDATQLMIGGLGSPFVAGTSRVVTVTAGDAYGNKDPNYHGSVHFTSSDGHAVLPADYSFLPADVGARTFNVILWTKGTQSVTATDKTTASIHGSQSVVVVTPLSSTYHPINPVRLLDTRSGNGLSGKLSANTPVTFQVTGRGGVPAGAVAVTGNVTVVNSSAGWALYLGPAAVSSPSTSTINFTAGQVAGNGLTVALGGTGMLSATYISSAGNKTDAVFDVTGYFTSDTSGDTYHPMTPARSLDTRNGTGLTSKLKANIPQTFAVAGRTGVPTNAKAVTGNVTVVNSTAGWAAYLGPDPIATPATSTVNFNAGEVKGNNLTVALSATGTLSATYISNSGNTTDLVFDVTGYYTADTTGTSFVPLTPARLLDTRSGNGLSGTFTANTPRIFAVGSRGGVPASAAGVTGNVTVVNETAGWAVFLGPTPTTTPTTSTINFIVGEVKGNGLTVALSNTGTLSATYISSAGNTTDLIFDVTGYFVK